MAVPPQPKESQLFHLGQGSSTAHRCISKLTQVSVLSQEQQSEKPISSRGMNFKISSKIHKLLAALLYYKLQEQ